MRLLLQKVQEASVSVEHNTVGDIKRGILVFLGIHRKDTEELIEKAIKKLLEVRVFPDKDHEKYFDTSLEETLLDILVVSQFTLYGSLKKGRRPSFDEAASPEKAKELYELFIKKLREVYQGKVSSGEFQAHMHVSLVNDGPVTFLLDI